MRKLVADEIVAQLIERSASSAHGQNSRLPAERDLAAEFGVSRNTVRLALKRLQEGGQLVRQVGRGTFLVTEEPSTIGGIIKRMEGASPADVMETRLLVEPSAAARAATNATSAELQRVRDAHNRAVDATEVRTFEHWDAEFHSQIFVCCGNSLLVDINSLVGMVRNQPQWFDMKARSFSEASRQRYCKEHAAIVDSLESRDPYAAREAMLTHLQSVKQKLLEI